MQGETLNSQNVVPVSIVVATYNSESRIQQLLVDLQRLQPKPRQLIVVDDGSNDRTFEILQQAGLSGFELIVVRQSRRTGPAAARNLGIQHARFPWIAFTDDDCRPQPGWLGQLYAAGLESGSPMIFGRIEAPGKRGFFDHYVENLGDGHFTANALYSRQALAALGGFDTRFPCPYLEDTDLFCRCLQLGKPYFAGSAVVSHPTRPLSVWTKVSRFRKYRADFLFYQKNPVYYRMKRRNLGPWAYLLCYVGVKHALATIWRERGRVLREPACYLKILLTLFLERVVLATLLGSQLWRSARGDKISRIGPESVPGSPESSPDCVSFVKRSE